MSRREELLRKIKDVPTLPAAAAEALRLAQNPNTAPAALTKAVECDPGLTANILRMANTAAYGGPRQIKSVKEAILRLGLRRIAALAAAAGAAPTVHKEIRGYGLPPGALWLHSLAVAVGAVKATEVVGMKTPDFLFTAALLHDVGKLVLGGPAGVDAAPLTILAEKENIPFDEAERRVLGVDHAEVGAALLAHWNLPDEIVEAVHRHHRPDEGSANPIVDIIHTVDVLSLGEGVGTGTDGLRYRLSATAAQRVGLKRRAAEMVLCEMLSGLKEAQALFGSSAKT